MSQEEAKIAFLKYVYQWPTFGSAFFEIKVSKQKYTTSVTILSLIHTLLNESLRMRLNETRETKLIMTRVWMQ